MQQINDFLNKKKPLTSEVNGQISETDTFLKKKTFFKYLQKTMPFIEALVNMTS